MNPERILVLVDFSDGSRVALERASQIALDGGASLHVLHAIGLHGVVPEAAISALEQAALEQIEQLVAVLREQAVRAVGRTHTGSVLEAFEWAEDELRPDLIVVGARGATRLSWLLLGSTAKSIVQHAFAPVLVVRGQLGDKPEPFRRILTATDFSPDPVCAARAAIGIGASDASMHVTHVFQSPPQAVVALGSSVLDQQRLEVGERLDRVAQELQAVPHLLEGDAPGAVVQLADDLGCDLIAVGRRGAGSASWFAPASVAGEVIRLAATSVITARRLRDRPEIHDDLEAVRAELLRSDGLATAQRATATELLRNLRRLVDDSRELRHEMLADFCQALDELAEDLQGTHPKLSAAIRSLGRALTGMGT